MNEEDIKEHESKFQDLVTPNNSKFFEKLLSDKKASKIFEERRELLKKHNIDLENEKAVEEFENNNKKAKQLLKKYKSRLRILQRRHA